MHSKGYKKLLKDYKEREQDLLKIISNGIKDPETMKKMLNRPDRNIDKAIRDYKIAQQIPGDVLYNNFNFRNFLKSIGFDERSLKPDDLDKMREEIEEFK